FYRLQAGRHAQGATGIDEGHFFITEGVDETTLSLFATARGPLGRPSPTGSGPGSAAASTGR
ncbi:MAG: hypothetical protein ACRDYV_22665, partial [Acidimicrobiia bacterium]